MTAPDDVKPVCFHCYDSLSGCTFKNLISDKDARIKELEETVKSREFILDKYSADEDKQFLREQELERELSTYKNDSFTIEQGKRISELERENESLKDQIAELFEYRDLNGQLKKDLALAVDLLTLLLNNWFSGNPLGEYLWHKTREVLSRLTPARTEEEK